MLKSIILIVLLFLSLFSYGQRDLKSKSIFTPIYGLTYKANVTDKDMASRWGFNSQIGLEVGFKLKNNLEFGIDGGFIFGKTFKETSIFESLYNDKGTITAQSGTVADVFYYLRGMNVNLHIGYVFSQLGHNPNSGLWVNVGVGLLGHKIRVETQDHVVPQLEGDILMGYDHLTGGFNTKQFIGYLFQHDRKFINFYAGIELVEGFTHNLRNYNFDVKGSEPDLRLDFMYSLKFGWMIPIYKSHHKDDYFVD
jgi:hypothetical protein